MEHADNRGLFITLEGTDGAGKSTQLAVFQITSPVSILIM